MSSLSIIWLLIIFAACAAATWFAGVALAKATDSLDTRYKLGDALGGLILLGIAGTLPEIAICFSAAREGNIPVIIGNLLGSIALKILVIVILDFAVKKKPLSFLAGSPILVIEIFIAVFLTFMALIGTTIPQSAAIYNFNPISILLIVAWAIGIYVVNRARKNPALYRGHTEAEPGRKHVERRKNENYRFFARKSNLYVITIFAFASLVILIAGAFLEMSGTAIAENLGIPSGIFAATILALVATLPEISTGLESVLIGDHQLAISDAIGGVMFNLIVFFFIDLYLAKPALSFAGQTDIFLASLGILMMSVYGIAFMVRWQKQYFRLGIDSILQIILYVGGIFLLTKL